MAAILDVIGRNAAAAAIGALLNNGFVMYETSGGVEVAKCGYGATAYKAASGGTVESNAITGDADAAGGTMGRVRLATSGDATVFTLSVGTTGSGADVIVTDLTIGAGSKMDTTSMSITVPAQAS